ncbi:MAG: hypothetical protein WBF75_17280 [Pseudonocardiaceae bacterium]
MVPGGGAASFGDVVVPGLSEQVDDEVADDPMTRAVVPARILEASSLAEV